METLIEKKINMKKASLPLFCVLQMGVEGPFTLSVSNAVSVSGHR